MTVQKITEAIKPLEQVAKINEIIDNLGSGGSGGFPDYLQEEVRTGTTTYTAEKDGWVLFNTTDAEANFYINEVQVLHTGFGADYHYPTVQIFMPVKTGDTYRSTTTSFNKYAFYPASDSGDEPVGPSSTSGSFGIPDYENGVSKTWNQNIKADHSGIVIAHDAAQQATPLQAIVNGTTLPFNDVAHNGLLSISFVVGKGDVWKVTGGDNSGRNLMFYPFKDEYLDDSRYITNCITEIPQDIKVELNNGTLTLKAGSKVYVPNGFEQDGVTKKFDIVILENDVSGTRTTSNAKEILFYSTNNNILNFWPIETYSGSSAPSVSYQYAVWYDTTNNLIKFTTDTGNTWTISYFSLPLCIYTQGLGQTISIDKVFNGFSYIGFTLFALPGVTGLLPNGRNEDGTLNNIKYTVDTVILREFSWDITGSGQYLALYSSGEKIGSSATNRPFYQQEETPPTNVYSYWYKPSENFTYATFESDTSWTKFPLAIIGKVVGDTTGKISSLTTKTTVKLIDENDVHNAEAVVETYSNGNNWYRIWSDGWCEQGSSDISSQFTTNKTINFLKPYRDANYQLMGVGFYIENIGAQNITSKTATGFVLSSHTRTSGTSGWMACGYIDQ